MSSLRKQTLQYTVAAVAVAAIVIVSSSFYLAPMTGQQGANSAKLVIQLTDPPEVPAGTSSLDLTYSSIALLVGEPAGGGQVTIKSVNVAGSATVDLLKLQNISKTVASASLPAGSTFYSLSFMVTSIMIDVSGTTSPVTLATGGSTLSVTLSRPTTIEGTDIALLRLNPVVVSTPSGYQLIPSAVGAVRGESEGDKGHEDVGSQQQLTSQDRDELNQASGSATASLKALSVSSDVTTLTIEVKNSGSGPIDINAIGIHGSFTVVGQSCPSSDMWMSNYMGDSPSTTTTTSTSTSTTTCESEHTDEVVFVPSGSSVSGTGCVSMTMNLVNGDPSDHGLTLTSGQCVDLTFSGKIAFGGGSFVLVPNTASGQVYEVHVVASEGANLKLSCTLPVSSTSCSVDQGQD